MRRQSRKKSIDTSSRRTPARVLSASGATDQLGGEIALPE
jgi:hypothetical protein